MVIITITHRHTGETLHTIELPDTGDMRRDKFDALATWRAKSGQYSTPVRITARRKA